jgi:hypothetical protein
MRGRGYVRNKGSRPRWRPPWRVVINERPVRGKGRPGMMTDGLVVPLKPGNAGGGKGP